MKSVKVKTYELTPQHDSRQSFYRKAFILYNGTTEYLKSYSTIVAMFNNETKEFFFNDWYSMTTRRHIKEFALQHNIRLKTKELEQTCLKDFHIPGYIG